MFLEVDEPLESFKRIANGHFFYTPLKTGLGETHREELKHMLNNWDEERKNRMETEDILLTIKANLKSDILAIGVEIIDGSIKKIYWERLTQDVENFIDELRKLYAEYTPEFAEAESGAKAEMIREVAKKVGEAGSRLATHNWRSAGAGNLGGWAVSRCLHFLNVLTGSVGTVGGTMPSAWNKFKPKGFSKPPAQKFWNELHFPNEYPLAHYEMSFQRIVAAINSVLAGRVEVKLRQFESYAVDTQRNNSVGGNLYGMAVINNIQDSGAPFPVQ